MNPRTNRSIALCVYQRRSNRFLSNRSIRSVIAFLMVSCLHVFGMFSATAWATAPSQVLLVYPVVSGDSNNNGIGDARELVDYYIAKRGVPADHVLGVANSVGTWFYYPAGYYANFYNDLVGPIKNKLAQLGPQNIDVILLVGEIPYTVGAADNNNVSVESVLTTLQSLSPDTNNIRRS